MHHPAKRRVGRLRALTLVAALLVSVFAAAIPASAAPGNGNGKGQPVVQPDTGTQSWVWTGSNELVQPKSWVWTGSVADNDELVSPQSWVWTGG